MRFVGLRRRRAVHDERGVESVAIIFVIPMLAVLIFGLVDIGFMFNNRMLYANALRDGVRSAAADGGLLNPRTTDTPGISWTTKIRNSVYAGGTCKFGKCTSAPTITCRETTSAGVAVADPNVADRAGNLLTCDMRVPYKPINGGLLNSGMGLGLGGIVEPFTVTATARFETGAL